MVILFLIELSLFIIVLNVSSMVLHLLTCFAFIKLDWVSLVFSLFIFLICIFCYVVFKLSNFAPINFDGKTK